MGAAPGGRAGRHDGGPAYSRGPWLAYGKEAVSSLLHRDMSAQPLHSGDGWLRAPTARWQLKWAMPDDYRVNFRCPHLDAPTKIAGSVCAVMAPTASTSMAGLQSRMQFSRASTTRRACTRGHRMVVQAKVDIQGGPRVIRGKCFVTRDVSATVRRWFS